MLSSIAVSNNEDAEIARCAFKKRLAVGKEISSGIDAVIPPNKEYNDDYG